MFWHENKENDINLISFNKSNYLKLTNPKIVKLNDSFDESEKSDSNNILDLSENFKVNMMIPSDWGPGKVVSVNKATKKVVLKIEGNDHTFDMIELRPYLPILLHVYFKDINNKDKRILINFNLFLDDTIEKIKKKIAGIFKADEKKVIIAHKGAKITNNKQKVSECGIYAQDNILVVINGLCNY